MVGLFGSCILYEIKEEDAEGNVAYIYSDLRKSLNIEVVNTICEILDMLVPKDTKYAEQINHVQDRPGHDRRYAIDSSKMQSELNWTPEETFETGLRKTVQWYLDNSIWCQNVQDGSYQRERLGTLAGEVK